MSIKFNFNSLVLYHFSSFCKRSMNFASWSLRVWIAARRFSFCSSSVVSDPGMESISFEILSISSMTPWKLSLMMIEDVDDISADLSHSFCVCSIAAISFSSRWTESPSPLLLLLLLFIFFFFFMFSYLKK